ncbi:sn-glycerol-3-phosphate ABC transporter ATP-binding protein UgpC [Rhodoferax sp.]|uniref:ABC transporter ATP-binding protein n=1 Tax=Rhodoferax sp. TaxID=50421 RepID=UPI00262FDEC1|nr:sn-glycerol-3-phosphate ABC transporter ATP-binding protein UgpC [Rhodoferax sp.]MDD2920213.1 sn-glycerol-3-phosphate ABC transporter ATP-binding protein UgpC [Rhodoferax sp.]
MGHLALKGIRKSYGDVPVIHGVDLEVRDGEFLVFVGPSGCGKSTMLRMIAGLESITEGDLLIDGVRANELRPADRGAAMVFQSYALYPHMTVAENMGFSLRMAGVKKFEREQVVQRTADVLRISHLLPRLPKALSGGERQRVAIGRAIVRKPKVFLFDEPLSNLDAALRVTMRIELARLHKELGTTMIYVTHDQVEAMTMGDRIAVFNKGRIEQLGAPMDLYARPVNEFVATFLGAPHINLISRPAQDASAAHAALWSATARQAPVEANKVGIRPEHLHLSNVEQGVPAQVMLVEHLGDASIIHLRVEGVDALLTAKVAAHEGRVVPGQLTGLSFDVGGALWFSSDGQLLS